METAEVLDAISLTEKAVTAALSALKADGEDGDMLRVSVIGGGCSGFEYNLDFDNECRDDDITINYGTLRVLIDPISLQYLRGTVIDYETSINGQGFKFNNPNAKRTCGCGSSFSYN